jgi:hypothetical protein
MFSTAKTEIRVTSNLDPKYEKRKMISVHIAPQIIRIEKWGFPPESLTLYPGIFCE